VGSGRIVCHSQFDRVNQLHDVLREVLQVGDDVLTYDRHIIDISQYGKWHIPEWKVAYTKMESGVYQNGKWHMPKWKVAYTTHIIPEWKVAYTRVAYPKFICEIYLYFFCIIDIA
jgi:hypothetical protein